MKRLLLCLIVLTFLLAACQAPTEAPGPDYTPPPNQGDETSGEAIDATTEEDVPRLVFTAYDLDFNEIDQDLFAAADLTLLNIWGTYCPSCIRELPYFGQLAIDYAAYGLQIVGVVVDMRDPAGNYQPEQIELVKEILAHAGADYLQLMPSDDLINHLLVAISAVPTTLFLNSDGQLIGEVIVGARSQAAWTEIVNYHLNLVRE